MIVVADTSPLRYLILIEHVQVLPALYGHVIVPPAVIMELNQERTPDLVKAWLSNMPEWLHVQAPMQALTSPGTVLGAGEREAIALAAELSADALLMDESRCPAGGQKTWRPCTGNASRPGGRIGARPSTSPDGVRSATRDELPRQ